MLNSSSSFQLWPPSARSHDQRARVLVPAPCEGSAARRREGPAWEEASPDRLSCGWAEPARRRRSSGPPGPGQGHGGDVHHPHIKLTPRGARAGSRLLLVDHGPSSLVLVLDQRNVPVPAAPHTPDQTWRTLEDPRGTWGTLEDLEDPRGTWRTLGDLEDLGDPRGPGGP